MANLNLNKVILAGRLTQDPELRKTPQGVSVTSFTIAVNRAYTSKNVDPNQQTADFINCVAWRQSAEFITRYFHKGSSICVEGSIQTRTWTDNNQNKRYSTEVLVDSTYFVDSKSENAGGSSYGSGSFDSVPSPVDGNAPSNFEELSNDDDLPF